MSKFIKTFKDLTRKDVGIAGGKGASLGEMLNAKISVPLGFVILASAFDKFLIESPHPKVKKKYAGKSIGEENLNVAVQAELDKVNYKDVNSVDRASNIIRDLIHEAPMPKDLEGEIMAEYYKLSGKLHKIPPNPPLRKGRVSPFLTKEGVGGGLFVAVRSSATAEDSSVASWAGELETYLDTTEKNLLENVKKCWSSLFTPRAIFYRNEKKLLKTKVSVAVVVQKMIESEISGIAFTVHPVTEDRRQMIIEAGWGLGEAIVSGSITPDSYVIDKKDMSIIDINITKQEKMIVRKAGGGTKTANVPKPKQEKQVLSGKQIIELAKTCAAIEKHYKKPQDIEWAFAKGKFYVVQSRPITTL
jgi:pyruvate,water dikinase